VYLAIFAQKVSTAIGRVAALHPLAGVVTRDFLFFALSWQTAFSALCFRFRSACVGRLETPKVRFLDTSPILSVENLLCPRTPVLVA
jgi:hypothetical protein